MSQKLHFTTCFVVPDKGAPQKVHLVDNFSGSESLKPKPVLKASNVSLIVSAKTSAPNKLLSPNVSKSFVSPEINLIILVAHLSVSLVLENEKIA